MHETKPNLPDTMLHHAAESVRMELYASSPWTGIETNIQIQVIRALAFLLVKANEFQGETARIEDSIRLLHKTVLDRGAAQCTNRVLHQMAETRVILTQADAQDLIPGMDRFLAEAVAHYVNKLDLIRHLTHFTAQNLDTGTNHIAVYVCAVYRIGTILQRDDLVRLAISTWDRMVADQHPNGYWAETTGGPATLYNHITMCCAGRMAYWTENALYREAALRAAAFHRNFSYPDGSIIETIDARTRYSREPEIFGDFVQSWTAQGRAFVSRKLQTLQQQRLLSCPAKQIGERVANLCENFELWAWGQEEEWELDRRCFARTIPGSAAVRRNGAWVLAVNGFNHLPQGRGGFTLDRTSLFSIWHESCGLIINGSGEPGEHPAQSFHFPRVHELDFCRYSIPERTEISIGDPAVLEPAMIKAEYRGGTAHMRMIFESDDVIRLLVKVNVRSDFYPIPFVMQLELRDGDIVNGVRLGTENLYFSSKELGYEIVSSRFSVLFQTEGAEYHWPHDPYNPYNRKDFKSSRDRYVSLLKIPVGPLGSEVVLKCNGK